MHALRYFPATHDHKPHETNTRRLVIGGFEIYGDKIFHAIILRVKIRKKQDYRIIEISSCKFCHTWDMLYLWSRKRICPIPTPEFKKNEYENRYYRSHAKRIGMRSLFTRKSSGRAARFVFVHYRHEWETWTDSDTKRNRESIVGHTDLRTDRPICSRLHTEHRCRRRYRPIDACHGHSGG